MKAPDPTTIDNRYRGNRMPGILETPMGGTYGITNTLDLGGEPKIQDYLGGIGTSTTGPGGSTLYTGGGSMPGPIAARPPGFVDRPGGPGAEQRPPGQIGGIDMGIAGLIPAAKPQNIGDDPQRILTQPKANPNPYSNKGLTGPYAGVLEDFKNSDYFRGIHSWTGMFGTGGVKEFNPFGAERGLFGDSDQEAGFLQFLDQARAGGNVSQEYQDAYNVFNPLEGDARKFDNMYEQKEGQSRYSKVLTPEQKAEIARFEAMSPDERRADFFNKTQNLATGQPIVGPGNMSERLPGVFNPIPQNPGAVQDLIGANPITLNPIDGFKPGFSTADFDDIQNPFDPSAMPTDNFADNTDFFNNMHSSGQQPTGGFDSKVFANELLTGIGDLFKQHFPESAQMAFNNSNQPQSQIEQPIQDATTFDVQPQQNTAYNPFSVNTIGGAFGGGY